MQKTIAFASPAKNKKKKKKKNFLKLFVINSAPLQYTAYFATSSVLYITLSILAMFISDFNPQNLILYDMYKEN